MANKVCSDRAIKIRAPHRRDFLAWKRYGPSYAMVLPYYALFMFFTVVPILATIVLSFTNFNMLQMPNCTGWNNYIRLFLDDEVFIIAVKNTLVFAIITGPISYFLCLLFAWLINELTPRMRALMTFIYYAPSISGNLYIVWSWLFSGDSYGLVNGFLMKTGFINEPIQWLTDSQYNLTIVIIVQLWLSLGTSFLSFIAGFQGMDRSLYEAGAIDGIRNRWQELIKITLPCMGPQLLFGAVMQISASFAVSSVATDLTGFPSTDYSTHTVVTHIRDHGMVRYEMGYASAISVVLFVAMLLTNYLIRKIIKKYADQ